MGKCVDWVAVEGAYRAGKDSLREIAGQHGISEGAIRKRAKKEGWLRDPGGTKRQIVRAAMAGGTREGTQYAARTIAEAANQDVADMSAGLAVARGCINRLSGMVEAAREPRDVKVIAEANRIAVETIRRIRDLDDGASHSASTPSSDVLSLLREHYGL
ncbi:hypothetical protein [Marichromatium gracile]|uniref:Phage terminase small subunit n=1 Tax=Marichromatium gracile TaxID=1048 RepID=A0ABR5VFQ6_MARGR|nr:hypothetical protein [Marichromatium gracile]KXX64190.1 hypothetical protein AY586_14680 [Marichromatium gracile]